VQAMPNDSWLILATKEVVKRRGYTDDGTYYRCACTPVSGGGWVTSKTATTFCLYTPMNLF